MHHNFAGSLSVKVPKEEVCLAYIKHDYFYQVSVAIVQILKQHINNLVITEADPVIIQVESNLYRYLCFSSSIRGSTASDGPICSTAKLQSTRSLRRKLPYSIVHFLIRIFKNLNR